MTVVGVDLDLDGGVATRVENRASKDSKDGRHGRLRCRDGRYLRTSLGASIWPIHTLKTGPIWEHSIAAGHGVG
jgi:hypothetical protein